MFQAIHHLHGVVLATADQRQRAGAHPVTPRAALSSAEAQKKKTAPRAKEQQVPATTCDVALPTAPPPPSLSPPQQRRVVAFLQQVSASTFPPVPSGEWRRGLVRTLVRDGKPPTTAYHDVRVGRVDAERVLRRVLRLAPEVAWATWQEWEQRIIAALIACDLATQEGHETQEGLLLAKWHGRDMVKLIVAPPVDMEPCPAACSSRSMWALTPAATALLASGVLPWRALAWRAAAGTRRASEEVVVVECLQTRQRRCASARGCTLSLSSRAESAMDDIARVWYVPCIGAWYASLDRAVADQQLARSCA